jgi:23S rRNA (uracil1939-C5)-methyltransferase
MKTPLFIFKLLDPHKLNIVAIITVISEQTINHIFIACLHSGLIERSNDNTQKNAINNVDFYKADLFKEVAGFEWFRGKHYNKALIDPDRSGAIEIVELLPKLGVERLVYVSCNSAALARNTAKLITPGYQLETAGVMDMFPQTAHVESIELFVKC